jgi:hypothetical protein
VPGIYNLLGHSKPHQRPLGVAIFILQVDDLQGDFLLRPVVQRRDPLPGDKGSQGLMIAMSN